MVAACLCLGALAGCGTDADDAAAGSTAADQPLGLAYLPDGPTRPGEPVRALAALPGGQLAAAQGDHVLVWLVDDAAAPPLELRGDGSTLDAVVPAEEGTVAARTTDGRVLVWDPTHTGPAAGAPAGEGSLPPLPDDEPGATDAQALSQDLVVVSGADGTVEVRRSDDPDGPPVTAFTGHRTGVLHLAVLSDGRVASGDADGVVHVWSPRFPDDGSVTFAGHGDAVTALAETAEGRLASASLDGTVQVWDPSDLGPGQPTVITVGEPATALAALPDGRLAVGTPSGAIHLVTPPPATAPTS